MSINELSHTKLEAMRYVDQIKGRLWKISLDIHSNPELGFKEENAIQWLTEFLEEEGFDIERNVAGLSTAFSADYGNGRPIVALLAEYDALPEVGHACGHNIIATSAIGAAASAKMAVNKYGGRIRVLGTPAEEGQGGKALMLNKGVFDHVDVAMMIHPSTHDTATITSLAATNLEIEYFGREAHAAASPDKGINALDAMILAFNGINALRQHIRSMARIHGVITSGGNAPNVIPGYSAAHFIIRTESLESLEELKHKVLHCFTGAATATGARLKYKWPGNNYAPLKNNFTLADLFLNNMKTLGRKTVLADPKQRFGSTDMGNISQVLPGLHAFVSITGKGTLVHSPAFTKAAKSERGLKGMEDAAKALAMTAVDIFASPDNLNRVKKEFQRSSI